MGSVWGITDVAGMPSLAGAWFAGPPPETFLQFIWVVPLFGEPAGLVTALGHDAALTAAILASTGRLDRAGLVDEKRLSGVLGKYRFVADGRCQRYLAVLARRGRQHRDHRQSHRRMSAT